MSASSTATCFHCGEPAGNPGRYEVFVDGIARPMCCAGCAAIASAITRGGLSAYYTLRTTPPMRAPLARESTVELEAFDLPEVQRPFVRANGTTRQAALLVEGITCGACIWLIEHALERVPGVLDAAVNLTARRIHVEWDAERVRLSRILARLAQLGYSARGFDSAAAEDAAARERRADLWRLFVAAFAMMQVMMYLLPVYVADGDMTADAEQLMRWASFVLTLPVVLWSAGPMFRNAWRDARACKVGMDAPVSLGIGAAFAASAWATVSAAGDVYFDSIAMFVFLLLGARYLEAQARARAGQSLRQLVKRTPAVAERLVDAGFPSAVERVAVSQLVAGDRIVIAPGSTIAADGTVVAGHSAADESLLTGEARTVPKAIGDSVIGGSINLSSPLTIAVTQVGPGSVLAGIVRLADRAQAARPRIAQLADRVAQWFVVALLAVAAVTGAIWMSVDPGRALWVTIAVLVVSCPCALSVASPAALAAATGAMHRAGMLIVRGHALEALPKVTHVVLDKTGTLTAGRMSLVNVERLDAESAERCVATAAALERGSEHAIGRALRAACAAPDIVVDALVNHPGRGIEGRIGDSVIRLGSPAFVAELTRLPLPQALATARSRATCVLLGDARRYWALFVLDDALRPGARSMVSGLQAQGMKVCLLSGDRRETVVRLAHELGVDDAAAEFTPEAKLAYVRDLQGSGACVAMIGDGINDAPVLAQAQVAIAMGNGTDLAQAAADIVLVGDDIARVPEAFRLARRTMQVIRENLVWALAYNAVTIPLAALGWITPLMAGAGMAASSLMVVLNALRLQSPLHTTERAPEPATRALASTGPAAS